MATINVLDSDGNVVAVQEPLPPGSALSAASVPVVIASDQSPIPVTQAVLHYVLVAAGVTNQVLGTTGAAGDVLAGVVLVPANTSPGAVVVTDNVTSFTIFAGGATSLVDLKPFRVDLGVPSTGGGWKLTTGAGISAVAIGRFT